MKLADDTPVVTELRNRLDPDILRTLEQLVELAKAGKVRSIATVAILSDATVTRSIVCPGRGGRAITLLGALDCLKSALREAIRGINEGAL